MAKPVTPTQNNLQPASFQKGFNNGYILAKHSPHLLNRLLPTLQASNDYLEGIQSGHKQYQKELAEKGKGQSTNPQNSPGKDRRHDLDKDR